MHAALNDTQMVHFRNDLITQIGVNRSTGAIIDVAALDLLDSFASRTLQTIAEMARLRGAHAVIVGIQPDIAYAMVELGIGPDKITTALDLEDGLAYLDAVLSRRSTPAAFRQKS